MWSKVLIFLLINFAGLALGGLFTGSGVASDWYDGLAKAPWTPPGWMFGAAWTTIMVCFAFYMGHAWQNIPVRKTLLILFSVQWLLNFLWNPVFFKFHQAGLGLVVIVALTLVIAFMLFNYWKDLKLWSILIFPYLIWLVIATSLNAYIFVKN